MGLKVLLGYTYEIIYRSGKENTIADALSRVPGSPVLNQISTPQVTLWNDIKKAAQDQPYMERIAKCAELNLGKPYMLKDGLVFYKNRVVVPPGSSIMKQLISEFHDTKLGGHSGNLRTFTRLSQQFF